MLFSPHHYVLFSFLAFAKQPINTFEKRKSEAYLREDSECKQLVDIVVSLAQSVGVLILIMYSQTCRRLLGVLAYRSEKCAPKR